LAARKIQDKAAREREIQHGDSEAQREELKTSLKKFNRIATMVKINRMVLRSQRRKGTWDSNKDAMGRPFNTGAQRHRNTKGRLEHRTQNNNFF
jgi:hypothetical protein